jgi:hypothetical protein
LEEAQAAPNGGIGQTCAHARPLAVRDVLIRGGLHMWRRPDELSRQMGSGGGTVLVLGKAAEAGAVLVPDGSIKGGRDNGSATGRQAAVVSQFHVRRLQQLPSFECSRPQVHHMQALHSWVKSLWVSHRMFHEMSEGVFGY